jgi:hypothetical protein
VIGSDSCKAVCAIPVFCFKTRPLVGMSGDLCLFVLVTAALLARHFFITAVLNQKRRQSPRHTKPVGVFIHF